MFSQCVPAQLPPICRSSLEVSDKPKFIETWVLIMLECPLVPVPVQWCLGSVSVPARAREGWVMELCLCWLGLEITWGCLPLSGAVLFSRKLQCFC